MICKKRVSPSGFFFHPPAWFFDFEKNNYTYIPPVEILYFRDVLWFNRVIDLYGWENKIYFGFQCTFNRTNSSGVVHRFYDTLKVTAKLMIYFVRKMESWFRRLSLKFWKLQLQSKRSRLKIFQRKRRGSSRPANSALVSSPQWRWNLIILRSRAVKKIRQLKPF